MNFSEYDKLNLLYDGANDAGRESIGEIVGLRIEAWLGENRKLNPGCKYLAVGAGAAKPELTLAKYFGIPDDHITLVDKSLPDTLKQLKTAHPEINYHYGEGLYHFLEYTHEQYDLVTAFLLEELFKDSRRMSVFIALLSQKVKPGGIVCVYPYNGADIRNIWSNNGFVPFSPADERGVLFYEFQGIPK